MSGKIMIWSAFVFLCAVQLCNGNVGTILKDFGVRSTIEIIEKSIRKQFYNIQFGTWCQND